MKYYFTEQKGKSKTNWRCHKTKRWGGYLEL